MRTLALWLTAKRKVLEEALALELTEAPCPGIPGFSSGPPASPPLPRPLDPGAPEFEALRRFRSFCMSALRGDPPPPPLDGLRVSPQRAERWIDGWVRVACREAGPGGSWVAEVMKPLADRFQTALRSTSHARSGRGQPRRSNRRLVTAAIDRIADAYLAVDVESGAVVDANPAAGALLGVDRDVLLGSPLADWVANAHRGALAVELDSLTEGSDVRAFRLDLCDRNGRAIGVELRMTRYAARGRELALLMARAPLLAPRSFAQI